MKSPSSSLFLISLSAYFIFAAIEEFIPGFVSDYFNVHILLIPTVLFLASALFLERRMPAPRERLQPAKGNVPLIVFTSFATLGILWFGANTLPLLWRVLVSAYGAVLVAGTLTILYKD